MSQSKAVIITGMSGAGRSQAANVMEDLGYFVVDNLPAEMIKFLIDQIGVPEGRRDKIAVVVDTRGGVTFEALDMALKSLLQRSVRTTVLFMDADDAALERRFEETRRSHPIAEGTLAERIAQERTAFEEIRGLADVIIDTTDLNVHELREKVEEAFEGTGQMRRLRVDVISFGFKRGTPRVVDVLFDVRFLPNPHWIPELRPLTGHDGPVRDHVLEAHDASVFIEKTMDLMKFLLPKYEAEGKAYLTIGVGCTGGRHRSVALANELTRLLRLATSSSSGSSARRFSERSGRRNTNLSASGWPPIGRARESPQLVVAPGWLPRSSRYGATPEGSTPWLPSPTMAVHRADWPPTSRSRRRGTSANAWWRWRRRIRFGVGCLSIASKGPTSAGIRSGT